MKREIDELEKYHEEIKRKNLKQKKYIKCEIIVSVGEKIPYHALEVNGVGPKEMAVCLKLLEITKEEIENQPNVKIYKGILDESKPSITKVKKELGGDNNE